MLLGVKQETKGMSGLLLWQNLTLKRTLPLTHHELIKPCILAGCPEGGTVLDPFGGSGTTAQVAINLNRNAILCELNPEYVEIAKGSFA
jgi:hypothetical protein